MVVEDQTSGEGIEKSLGGEGGASTVNTLEMEGARNHVCDALTPGQEVAPGQVLHCAPTPTPAVPPSMNRKQINMENRGVTDGGRPSWSFESDRYKTCTMLPVGVCRMMYQLQEVFHMQSGHATTFGYPRAILTELRSV